MDANDLAADAVITLAEVDRDAVAALLPLLGLEQYDFDEN